MSAPIADRTKHITVWAAAARAPAPSPHSCGAPTAHSPTAPELPGRACNGALVVLQGQRCHDCLPCALPIISQVTQVVPILQMVHPWQGHANVAISDIQNVMAALTVRAAVLTTHTQVQQRSKEPTLTVAQLKYHQPSRACLSQ